MTKNKTILLLFASLCLVTATAIPSSMGMNRSFSDSHNLTIAEKEVGKKSAWEPNAAETQADGSKLTALTISSTITETSHSFGFTFSTGGQGYSDTTSTYLIAPNDEDYQEYYNMITGMDSDGRTALDETNSLDDNFDNIPSFKAYVFSLNVTLGKQIILPKRIARNHLLGLVPEYINLNAFDFSTLSFSDPVNTSEDINIFIPNNINYVYDDSFVNLEACSSRVHFYVELSQTQVSEQWESNWNHGASVVYSYSYDDHVEDVPGLNGAQLSRIIEYTTDTEGNIVPTTVEYVQIAGVFLARGGASFYGDENANFFLGFLSPTDSSLQLPLYLEYQVLNGGVNETRYQSFVLSSSDGYYNSVGKSISSYSTTLNIDISLAKGETVDTDSLVIHNIYAKDEDSSQIIPDVDSCFYIVPQKTFVDSYSIDQFVDISFKGISSFMNYTSVEAILKKGSDELYQSLNPSSYRSNEANIASGKSYIRYRISSLSQSNYVVGYGDNQSVEFQVSSPVSQYIINSPVNKVSYVFKNNEVASDFTAKNLHSLDFVGFYVTIDIYGQNGPLARSAVSTRFGYVNIMPDDAANNVFDVNALLIIMMVSYIALFVIGTIALFFYWKNKYKNDEFRRVKPKKYFIKAFLGLCGSAIVILAVTFIILRATLFANAIVVYNPVDPFIIIFMIASVLIIGYFTKFMVVQTKASNTRRKAKMLKLDQDKAEDGTN